MNPENHEKANLRQNPRESHDMTTSSTARAQGRADRRTQSVCDCAASVRQCGPIPARVRSRTLRVPLKRPDKLTIVEFPISTELLKRS